MFTISVFLSNCILQIDKRSLLRYSDVSLILYLFEKEFCLLFKLRSKPNIESEVSHSRYQGEATKQRCAQEDSRITIQRFSARKQLT